jgi:hypothetical protein
MRPVNIRLVEQARSIFTELGYTVEGGGREFTAQRDWKSVRVTMIEDGDDLPETGSLRCFVTESQAAGELRRRLRQRNPDYEWAIIGIDGEDYHVERAPPGPRAHA